jgi:hypothetical protein
MASIRSWFMLMIKFNKRRYGAVERIADVLLNACEDICLAVNRET